MNRNNTVFDSCLRIKIYYFLISAFLFFGCKKSDPYPPIYENIYGNSILVENSDTLPGIIYLYYKDSITISKVLTTSYDSGQYACNNVDFSIKGEKLFLKNPTNLSKVDYSITLTSTETKNTYPLKVKIHCWIKDKYNLYAIVNGDNPDFLYTHNDTTYSILKGSLLYSVKNQSKNVFCSKFLLIDQIYNQMACNYGFYAIRTGGKIYVSKNLKNWELIFDGARGIKESITIVKNVNGYELLFSDYTPGTVYVRHYLRAYNLKSKKLSIRKIFYTTEDYLTNGLTPQARHIHFLVQDYYSDIIFLGTGDTNPQSSIYYSLDQGISFKRLGGGSQKWRSLSMFFTEDYIFWNMDSQLTQYLIRLKKSDLQEDVSEVKLSQFPLINSAHWCSERILLHNEMNYMFVMSSNTEGRLYDNNFRNFGIIFKNDEPQVYELFAKKATGIYSQWYPIGTDNQNNILFLDLETLKSVKYKVQ